MFKYNFSKLYYNFVVLTVILGVLGIFSLGLKQMIAPLSTLNTPISLDPIFLPEYLLRTGMRFFIAMCISVIVAIIYATAAAKNARIGRFLIPLLDVFQSVPVLGYLSFAVTAFVSLAPNNVLGVELAVIFAVFTAQVWNIIFSLYKSFITTPNDLYDVTRVYGLNKWKIFWKIEIPFAIPGLVWNIILSMAGSWFFIVVQEVVAVGTQSYTMPGMGAYIALALKNKDLYAISYAFIAMTSLIFIFNELFFKPLVAWGYKFRYEFNVGANTRSHSWLLTYMQRSTIFNYIVIPIKRVSDFIINLSLPSIISARGHLISIILEVLWWAFVVWALVSIYQRIYIICYNNLDWHDIYSTLGLGVLSATRVMSALLFASILWIPIGIFIGLRPSLSSKFQPIVQFMTAIPANFYWPFFVFVIVHFKLNPNIWLSFMMVIGAQWYILYNVIAGTQNIPTDILEAAAIYKLRSLSKAVKIILPAIFPFYLTGLITAAGASWNASIVAEIITWGDTTLTATGLGSFITINTNAGRFPQIALGIMIMIVFVITIDHIIWKPLYKIASTRFRLE